jgi:hypothetical protein
VNTAAYQTNRLFGGSTASSACVRSMLKETCLALETEQFLIAVDVGEAGRSSFRNDAQKSCGSGFEPNSDSSTPTQSQQQLGCGHGHLLLNVNVNCHRN